MAITVSSNEAIAATPFLIRKLSLVDGNGDAAAVTHSGPAAEPDMVLISKTVASAAVDISCTAKSTTTITFDNSAGATYDVFCIWFAQADGGIALPG